MILISDDYERIYRQLADEKEKVQYHLHKNARAAGKKFLASRGVPVWHWVSLTMPKSKNTYLLYYYALTWDEIKARSCFSGAPLIINDDKGHRNAILYRRMKEHLLNGETVRIEALHVYTGHFFSRYRERMKLPDTLSVNDVITSYFGRNGAYLTELDYEEVILEKNRHKGNSAWGVEDGITLAEKIHYDGGLVVFKHNTFLSRGELKPNQAAALPSRAEMRNYMMRFL